MRKEVPSYESMRPQTVATAQPNSERLFPSRRVVRGLEKRIVLEQKS